MPSPGSKKRPRATLEAAAVETPSPRDSGDEREGIDDCESSADDENYFGRDDDDDSDFDDDRHAADEAQGDDDAGMVPVYGGAPVRTEGDEAVVRKAKRGRPRRGADDAGRPKSDARRKYDGARLRVVSAKAEVSDAEEALVEATRRLTEAKASVSRALDEEKKITEEVADGLLAEDNAWNGMYRLLAAFKVQHGHANVKRNPVNKDSVAARSAEESKLGGWIGKQRRNYRLPEDHPEHIDPFHKFALDRIGLVWSPHAVRWNERYEVLKKYGEDHGTVAVPYKGEDGRTSWQWRWCKRQRDQYRLLMNGDKSEMNGERKELLDELGFDWEPEETKWEVMFARLTEYKKKYGHCNVTGEEPHCYELHDWTKQQKRLFNYGELSPTKMEMLDGLAFCFRKRDETWLRLFHEFMAYKSKYNATHVIDYYNKHGALVSWVRKQRKNLAKWKESGSASGDDLTNGQAKLLVGAGLETSVTGEMRRIGRVNNPPPPGLEKVLPASSAPPKGSWEEKFAEMLDYRRDYETLAVVARGDKYQDLEEWVTRQIFSYAKWKGGNKEGEVDDARAGKLEIVGFPEDVTIESIQAAKKKRRAKEKREEEAEVKRQAEKKREEEQARKKAEAKRNEKILRRTCQPRATAPPAAASAANSAVPRAGPPPHPPFHPAPPLRPPYAVPMWYPPPQYPLYPVPPGLHPPHWPHHPMIAPPVPPPGLRAVLPYSAAMKLPQPHAATAKTKAPTKHRTEVNEVDARGVAIDVEVKVKANRAAEAVARGKVIEAKSKARLHAEALSKAKDEQTTTNDKKTESCTASGQSSPSQAEQSHRLNS